MFRKIIVGVDGAGNALDAAALGEALAGLSGAELVLVHCHATSAAEGAPELLAEVAASLDCTPRTVSRPGPGPEQGLADAARDEDADLIVIGSSHRGRFEQIFVGDVTSSLLDRAPCSVAIAERGFAGRKARIGSIAVAVDEEGASSFAAHLGAELARAAGIDLLRLVHVDKPAAPYAAGKRTPDRPHSSALQEAVAPVGPQRVEFELRTGPPADELVALSDEVDLVLLGRDVTDDSRSRFVSRILAHTAHSSLIICIPGM